MGLGYAFVSELPMKDGRLVSKKLKIVRSYGHAIFLNL